jgi:peptide/nickel transport system substrate-binding protein
VKNRAIVCIALVILAASFAGIVSLQAARAQGEKVLVIAQQSDPGILNNIVGDTLGSFFVHYNVWSELVHLSADQQEIQGQLAASWTISSDGLNYTFHLRPGVTWHDGTPFTAEDVKFTMDQAVALPTWAIAYLQAVDHWFVNDPLNITFVLKSPDAGWLTLLAFGSDFGLNIMPKHIYEGTNITTNPANQAPIGTGPFKFVSHIAGQSVTLAANDDYWGGRPPVDRVVLKIIPTAATALQELQAGTVQYLTSFDNGLAFSQVPAIVQQPNIAISHPTGGVLTWFLFNTLDPVVGNATLRQAMAYAINRTELGENAYFGYAAPMDGFYLEGKWYNQNAELPYDPAMAVQLLDQLGLTPDANGVRLTVEFAFHPLFGMDVEADVVKEQLRQVGIVLTLWSGDYPTWFDKVHIQGDYQIALRASQIGPDPDLLWQWLDPTHEGESGSTFFNHTEMNDLFSQARQLTDFAQRKALYDQVQVILRDHVPVLPLTNIQDVNLWRSDMVSNLGPQRNTDRWDLSAATVIESAAPSPLSIYAIGGIVAALVLVAAAIVVWRMRARKKAAGPVETEEMTSGDSGEERPPGT